MTRQLVAALIGFAATGWFVATLPAAQQSFAVKVDGVAVDVLVSRDRCPPRRRQRGRFGRATESAC
jgi:hypothetical protein